MNLLENIERVNIIDKLVRIQASKGKAYNVPLLIPIVCRLWPEYLLNDKLEKSLQVILSYQ